MKAILVIDKPECCTGCLLGIYNKKWFCLVTNKDIDITDRYNIPSWCPLKPMPKKINEKVIDFVPIGYWSSYDYEAKGWNDCIEEIEK